MLHRVTGHFECPPASPRSSLRPEALLGALADRDRPVLAPFAGHVVVAATPRGRHRRGGVGRDRDRLRTPIARSGGGAGRLDRAPCLRPGRHDRAVAGAARRPRRTSTRRRRPLRHGGDLRPLRRVHAGERRGGGRSTGSPVPPTGRTEPPSPIRPTGSRSRHRSMRMRTATAVDRARALIRAGDCYQVNLTQRLSVPWPDSPLALAQLLWDAAEAVVAPGVYRAAEGAVVSASPERLVRVTDGVADSEPIKGTAPPGEWERLSASAKDRAEHVMIVDLVRNDLGRVARAGRSVVPRLFGYLRTPVRGAHGQRGARRASRRRHRRRRSCARSSREAR